MDPNAVLEELRGMYNEFVQDGAADEMTPGEVAQELDHALTLFDNLDNWIISGGFCPAEWDRQ